MEEANHVEESSALTIPSSVNEGNANTEEATGLLDQNDSLNKQPQQLEENSGIKRFLRKHAPSNSLDESGLQSTKSASLNVQSPVARNSGSVDVVDTETVNSGHKRSNTLPDVLYRASGDTGKGVIDTAAPFESVRQAVSKFGGIVGKVQQSLTTEKHKGVQVELRRVNDEVSRCKKQSESALVAKNEVLNELEITKKLVEDLKLNLEKSEVQEVHAKQDLVLAELRVQELENGIDAKESAAIKRELEVGCERHTTAVAELSSIKQELESLRKEYDSVVKEMDSKMSKAGGSVSASEEIEKTAEHLTMEFVTKKMMLETSQTALLNAEENRANASMTYKQEKLNWEKDLKQAETEAENLSEQLQATNVLKSKLETACSLLTGLKSELASYVETKLNEEESNEDEDQQRQANDTEKNTRELLCRKRKELEVIRTEIENAKDDVNCLRIAASSLNSELEKEKESLITTRNREGNASQSESALEAELERINAELELIQTREREAREKMIELPKQLGVATQQAEEAKALANSVREELKKAKEENEQAKAMSNIVETQLNAALMEIEAARASAKLAASAYKALEESENAPIDSLRVVTLPAEEYYRLSKKAHEVEEQANKRVLSVIEEIKAVKESESQSLLKLEEANKTIVERKEGLKEAKEKAQKAKEEKVTVEQELETWRTEHETETITSDEAGNLVDQSSNHELKNLATDEEDNASECPATTNPNVGSEQASSTAPANESSKKKSSFFPRVVTFLGKKKAHTVKE